MITAGDFRNGVTFEMDGQVVSIIEFQHVKPGKGAAFVRTKIRNVITGAVVEKTFNPTEKFPTAFIERKDMEYLYQDGDLYYFMDNETYEQLPIGKAVLGSNFKFVKENMVCKVLSYKGNVFGVEPPWYVWFFPTRVMFSVLNRPHSLFFRLLRLNPVLRAIQLQTLQSLPFSRQVRK